MLSQAHQQMKNESDTQDKGINIDPNTYCKLGHFNLLMEDYPKGKNFLIDYKHLYIRWH